MTWYFIMGTGCVSLTSTGVEVFVDRTARDCGVTPSFSASVSGGWGIHEMGRKSAEVGWKH
jgi:hypothetical protein